MLDEDRANAGESFGQRIGAHDQHRPHNFLRQQRPYADGMTQQQVALQRACLLRGDDVVFEVAETGGDAIGNDPSRHQSLYCCPRSLQSGQRRRVQLRRPAPGHGHDIVDQQPLTVYAQSFLHGAYYSAMRRSSRQIGSHFRITVASQ